MARLINADLFVAAIAFVKKHLVVGDSQFLQGYEAGLRGAVNAINELPTVDAVPVVHGRWLDFTRKRNGLDICYVRCMVCGKERGFDYGLNYCPNCGADMRGAEDATN